MTCVESGSLKIWSLPSDESSVISELKSEIKAGQDINCAKKSKFSTETSVLIASGGKENELKIWDVNKCEQPIFRAKNVADNWMQLREPVWVMCVDFVDQNKVAIGTAYHQVIRLLTCSADCL
jgi:ribosome biogenesis protein NSA1